MSEMIRKITGIGGLGKEHYIPVVYYCVCDSEANAEIKTAKWIGTSEGEEVSPNNFELYKGMAVAVLFVNGFGIGEDAEIPEEGFKLNICNTGNKRMIREEEDILLNQLKANTVILFTYDGTDFRMISGISGAQFDNLADEIRNLVVELEQKVVKRGGDNNEQSTTGDDDNPIYVTSGKVTAIGGTYGSPTNPIWLNQGHFTASTVTVGGYGAPGQGGAIQFIPTFLENGNITSASANQYQSINIGSYSNPIYMKGGAIQASTQTVGSLTVPVYLNNGVIAPTELENVYYIDIEQVQEEPQTPIFNSPRSLVSGPQYRFVNNDTYASIKEKIDKNEIVIVRTVTQASIRAVDEVTNYDLYYLSEIDNLAGILSFTKVWDMSADLDSIQLTIVTINSYDDSIGLSSVTCRDREVSQIQTSGVTIANIGGVNIFAPQEVYNVDINADMTYQSGTFINNDSFNSIKQKIQSGFNVIARLFENDTLYAVLNLSSFDNQEIRFQSMQGVGSSGAHSISGCIAIITSTDEIYIEGFYLDNDWYNIYGRPNLDYYVTKSSVISTGPTNGTAIASISGTTIYAPNNYHSAGTYKMAAGSSTTGLTTTITDQGGVGAITINVPVYWGTDAPSTTTNVPLGALYIQLDDGLS